MEHGGPHAESGAIILCGSRIDLDGAQIITHLKSASKKQCCARVGRTCAFRAHLKRIPSSFSRKRPRFDPDSTRIGAQARAKSPLSQLFRLLPPKEASSQRWRTLQRQLDAGAAAPWSVTSEATPRCGPQDPFVLAHPQGGHAIRFYRRD